MTDTISLIRFFRCAARETEIVHFQRMMTKAADDLEAYVTSTRSAQAPVPEAMAGEQRRSRG